MQPVPDYSSKPLARLPAARLRRSKNCAISRRALLGALRPRRPPGAGGPPASRRRRRNRLTERLSWDKPSSRRSGSAAPAPPSGGRPRARLHAEACSRPQDHDGTLRCLALSIAHIPLWFPKNADKAHRRLGYATRVSRLLGHCSMTVIIDDVCLLLCTSMGLEEPAHCRNRGTENWQCSRPWSARAQQIRICQAVFTWWTRPRASCRQYY